MISGYMTKSFEKNPPARVLIVNDSHWFQHLLVQVLQMQYYDTAVCETGQATLQALTTFVPDVVLLDAQLPDIDGYETCRRLRETSTVPVIMLLTQPSAPEITRALDLGADSYLVKPISLNELSARIRALLRRQ